MKNKYSIENLIITFKKHLEISRKEQKEREEKYEKEYGKKMPNYCPDPEFHITEALMNMCTQIQELKEWKKKVEND